uniref:Transcription elongation factor S-II n=1 Tax=Trichuris muris TaxID=70415 RepID=A0A5S6QRQ0_TRIMR
MYELCLVKYLPNILRINKDNAILMSSFVRYWELEPARSVARCRCTLLRSGDPAAGHLCKRTMDYVISLDGLKNVDVLLLSKTHIGEAVNKLRRKFAQEPDIHSQAASLLKKWKRTVQSTQKHDRKIQHESNAAPRLQSAADDPIRMKSAKLLTNALKGTEKTENASARGTDSEDRQAKSLSELGEEIERLIFEDTGMNSANRQYRARVRSRVINLRDPRNANLAAEIVKGIVSPNRIATMSSEAMAPDELRRLRQSFRKDSLRNYSLPDAGGILHSSTFLCQKCEQRDCSYNVGQERLDGDYEPVAVTLVACNRCGNRWKSY